MDDIFGAKEEKRGINKAFLGAVVVALAAIGLIVWLLSFRPSMEEQTARILAGSFQPGSSEYDELNKDIIISTDPETVQSPTGMGTISMFIKGKIRNKGTHTITAL